MNSPPGSGEEGLLSDVIKVPRDKDAKRLVDAIIKAASNRDPIDTSLSPSAQVILATIEGDATRLRALLEERDADMLAALERAASFIEDPGGFEKEHGQPEFPESSISCWAWQEEHVMEPIRHALARARGGA